MLVDVNTGGISIQLSRNNNLSPLSMLLARLLKSVKDSRTSCVLIGEQQVYFFLKLYPKRSFVESHGSRLGK